MLNNVYPDRDTEGAKKMETTQMEPDREARLNKALMLLSNVDYLDKLVGERFNAIYMNLDLR
jgi:hypothetical protein